MFCAFRNSPLIYGDPSGMQEEKTPTVEPTQGTYAPDGTKGITKEGASVTAGIQKTDPNTVEVTEVYKPSTTSPSASSEDPWLLVTEGQLPPVVAKPPDPYEAADPYEATWSMINTYEQKGKEAARLAEESGQVGNNADALYRSWDFAREDYRKVNLKGTDPILRNTEHYLLRKMVSGGGVRTIPNGLPFMEPGPWNPTVIITKGFVKSLHDPVYNPLRKHVLEHIFSIAKTTPDMDYFEEKGYEAGEDYKRQASERHWKHFFEGNPR